MCGKRPSPRATMMEPEYKPDEAYEYECYECGTITTSADNPTTCPECGSGVRNRHYPIE